MSRITIIEYEGTSGNRMCLDDWLEAHKLDIRVRQVGANNYKAEFRQQVFTDDHTDPRSVMCESPLAAVQNLLHGLRGIRSLDVS